MSSKYILYKLNNFDTCTCIKLVCYHSFNVFKIVFITYVELPAAISYFQNISFIIRCTYIVYRFNKKHEKCYIHEFMITLPNFFKRRDNLTYFAPDHLSTVDILV